jgi:hypothetical protein
MTLSKKWLGSFGLRTPTMLSNSLFAGDNVPTELSPADPFMHERTRYRASMCWVLVTIAMLAPWCSDAPAYERYKNAITGVGNCSVCHGHFTDSISPKGTVFPLNSKHDMHRSSYLMGTDCN